MSIAFCAFVFLAFMLIIFAANNTLCQGEEDAGIRTNTASFILWLFTFIGVAIAVYMMWLDGGTLAYLVTGSLAWWKYPLVLWVTRFVGVLVHNSFLRH